MKYEIRIEFETALERFMAEVLEHSQDKDYAREYREDMIKEHARLNKLYVDINESPYN